ncbi:MAG TPA: hypothetical protein GXX16_00680 [Epulopiscium sp.]|nr:hypothetical protein [Candidatus Epulonipiscium sp.]
MSVMIKKDSWKKFILAAVLLAAGLAGLTGSESLASSNDMINSNILSKNIIDFNKDSYNENLILKMTDGRYYEEKEPGPYMGPNWEGKFYIQLIDQKGKILSELDLNKAFNEQKLIFQSVFNIEFDDYNNDGSMDFAIGQYVSGNSNAYKLFTITSDGKIEELPIKDQAEILSSGGNKYSKEFEKIDEVSFKNQCYDNTKGEMVETCYTWSDTEKQFIKYVLPLTPEIQKIIADDYVKDMKCTREVLKRSLNLYFSWASRTLPVYMCF